MEAETMSDGWIRLHRKVRDSAVFQDEGLFKLWCLCLLSANHKDGSIKVDGLAMPVEVKRGQFITGRYALHAAYYCRKRSSNFSASTLWRRLETLRDMQNLHIETNSRFSLVTVVNYEEYQTADNENEQANEQPVHSRCTAGEQPVRTNKNEKNEKKGVRAPGKRFIPPTIEEVRAYCQERNSPVDPQRFLDYHDANGWKVGKNPMQDWKATVRTWEGNGFSQNGTAAKSPEKLKYRA